MKTWLIDGGRPLQGEVTIQGAKNAAQKILPATVLWPGTYIINRLPHIQDVAHLLHILQFLGATITFLDTHRVHINTEEIVAREIPPELTALSTGSFLFAGALLGRFGEAKVWHPGGDRIGKRPVTWHVEAFRQLGAKVDEENAYYEVSGHPLQGGHISFARPTANGTINAVITAARARGKTRIENLSPEPEIRNALQFFQTMGTTIRWDGSHALEVEGSGQETSGGEITLIPDRNDAATFLVAGVLGHGPVTLRDVCTDHVLPLLDVLRQVGATVDTSTVNEKQTITVRCDDFCSAHIHLTSRPFPAFSTDWGPMIQTLLTQVPGQHFFHETIFARRFAHVPELIRMGAQIKATTIPIDETRYNFDRDLLAPDAHAIEIRGPAKLCGTLVHANDVRAGAALALAGLRTEGQTTIFGVEQIERGYEDFAERLQQLGASVSLDEQG